MGRTVRMVPPGWEHPRDANGRFVPLLERERWVSQATDGTPEDERVAEADCMPDFGDAATLYCLYEDTSEGTPLTPAFETKEELARWCADQGVPAFGGVKATYEWWLATIERGSSLFRVGPGTVAI